MFGNSSVMQGGEKGAERVKLCLRSKRLIEGALSVLAVEEDRDWFY
jgi:hypothetical protein